MNYLIIYDNTGYIISQMAGDIREPQGVPFMWVEIPDNKYIQKVDVTTEPHTPMLLDINVINYENATLDEFKKHQINTCKENLAKYLTHNPIFSTCHNEEGDIILLQKISKAFC